jgi:anti-sigma regulatory factor (Ser/Thr protein kinase)
MSVNRSKERISWNYPASLQNVEQVCSDIARFLTNYSLSAEDRFAINLLLRESLNNAVIHGCGGNPQLSFSCTVTVSPREGLIVVTDEGLGFNWRKSMNEMPSLYAESGRGLFIYTTYADSIVYNETGNCVTLTRIFNRGEKNG